MNRQIWIVSLNCGLIAREMLDIRLLNKIRAARTARKWKNEIPPATNHYKTAALTCAWFAMLGMALILLHSCLWEG